MNADTQNHVELLTARLDGSIRTLDSLRDMLPDVLRIGHALLERLENGGGCGAELVTDQYFWHVKAPFCLSVFLSACLVMC